MRFSIVLVCTALTGSVHAAEQIRSTQFHTFAAQKTIGKVTAMSGWGGQRRITPQEAVFKHIDSPDERVFQVLIGGPVAGKQYKSNSSYHASGSFHFKEMSLPLKEGATYQGVGFPGGGDWTVKATYQKGMLVIDDTMHSKRDEWSLAKGAFPIDEILVKHLEVKASPDLSRVSEARYVATEQQVTPTGVGKARTLTRAWLKSLTEAKQ